MHPLLPDSSCLSSSHSSSCAPFSSSSSWPLIPLQPSLWHNCHIVSYSKSQGLCQDLASCVASHTTQYKTVMDSYYGILPGKLTAGTQKLVICRCFSFFKGSIFRFHGCNLISVPQIPNPGTNSLMTLEAGIAHTRCLNASWNACNTIFAFISILGMSSINLAKMRKISLYYYITYHFSKIQLNFGYFPNPTLQFLYGKNTLHKPPSHLRLGFAHDFTPGPAPHHNKEFVHVLAVETNWLHPQSLTA